jgi:ATP-binding cassette subfamily F protein 3
MGKNGAGKSTLLRLSRDKVNHQPGVSAPKEAVIAYLPQHLLTMIYGNGSF